MSNVKYVAKPTADSITKAIVTVSKTATTLRNQVQVCAVSILQHAVNCGDYSKANDLVNALGNGINAKALVEFFVIYGGLKVDEKEGMFVGWNKADAIDIDGAKAKMWYDLKKQNPFEGFDLQVELAKLIKKAKKASEKTGDDAEKVVIDDATLVKLNALIVNKA